MNLSFAALMFTIGFAIVIAAILFNGREGAEDQGTIIVLLFICGFFLMLLGGVSIIKQLRK